jgi:hypothetical protein
MFFKKNGTKPRWRLSKTWSSFREWLRLYRKKKVVQHNECIHCICINLSQTKRIVDLYSRNALFEYQSRRKLSWNISRFYSVYVGKCQNSARINLFQFTVPLLPYHTTLYGVVTTEPSTKHTDNQTTHMSGATIRFRPHFQYDSHIQPNFTDNWRGVRTFCTLQSSVLLS